MATAAQWVRNTLSQAGTQPLVTETVWKSLDRHVGQGAGSLDKIRAVLDYIDNQLIERTGGRATSALWTLVADYLDRTQEEQAAA